MLHVCPPHVLDIQVASSRRRGNLFQPPKPVSPEHRWSQAWRAPTSHIAQVPLSVLAPVMLRPMNDDIVDMGGIWGGGGRTAEPGSASIYGCNLL